MADIFSIGKRQCALANVAVVLFFLCLTKPLFAADLQAEQPVYQYCVDPDWLPYEALRYDTHIGISADYFFIFKSATNLNLELKVTESWTQTLEFLKTGQCDIATMLNRSAEREEYLLFSDIYFQSPNVLVSQHDEPFLQDFEHIGDRTLAAVKGYHSTEFIKRYYPQIELLEVETELDGLRLVSEGKVPLLVGSMLSINALIQDEGLRNLKIAGWGGPEDQLRVGVTKENEHLLEGFNRAINDISEAEHVRIFKQWNNIKIVSHENYGLAIKLSLAFMVIILLFVFRNRYVEGFNTKLQLKNRQLESMRHRLQKTNADLAFLSEHDQLTKLYNRTYFYRELEKEIRSQNRMWVASSLILIDIDYFKEVNDTHGHNCGDEVLMQLAQILQSTVREVDLAARWGGEEFVVLCPNATTSDAQKLAGRIVTALDEHNFAKVGKITCSMGIAERRKEETFVRWFDRTDAALYQAKQCGRNQTCIAK